mmetsp:Transcript_33337/g.55936  ORF Transcript_33337/g.55936 Transcript_33337/m.55936 type:complete len:309 (+) Transcript_33337:294-1220(+)|eukprot:CAMPEP_0198200266 /NCGR_PEP_ID=MMETSP1445-20131203/3307_1 /TAXON_ID=36898 /ORGANISM="Pyramimonas sp., Strain CCMP2087" /LENGTH=308 /DNA_ID=CAMNT_0043870277 /DNA_START=263 /DNA_END=1189 /DNA_ORIENTATION=+
MPSLQSLKLPELSHTVLEALRRQGVTTLEHFLTRVDPLDIPDEAGCGTSNSKALEAILRHIQHAHSPPVLTGIQLEADLRRTRSSSTGYESVDGLLRGGLRSAHVYEVTGVSGSGKTQVCLSAVASYVGDGLGNVIYVDTTNSFSAERVAGILRQRFGQAQNIPAVLGNIKVLNAFDSHSLLNLIDELQINREVDVGMLVIDSLSALVGPVLGRGQTQGHNIMISLGNALRQLALDRNAVVLYTNHSVGGGRPEDQSAAEHKPALGVSWRNQPHVRVQVSLPARATDDGKRHARVVNGGEPGEVSFCI